MKKSALCRGPGLLGFSKMQHKPTHFLLQQKQKSGKLQPAEFCQVLLTKMTSADGIQQKHYFQVIRSLFESLKIAMFTVAS